MPDEESQPWPIPARVTHDLHEALTTYARASAEVKRALIDAPSDDGAGYALASAAKEGAYKLAKAVFENVLAHIGVHAK